MANKSDNYLAHVEALKEFLPHAPELNSGSDWTTDFSFYKVGESSLNYNMLTSTPHWTKIDIRHTQAIACYAPVGWILVLTDLPNNTPMGPTQPMTNITQLKPGERIGVANKDWIHATWLPNFSFSVGGVIYLPTTNEPTEKYLVTEHNPNKPFTSSASYLQSLFTITGGVQTLFFQLRNIYPHRLFFDFHQTDEVHPAHSIATHYHFVGVEVLRVTTPLVANDTTHVRGCLRTQEEAHLVIIFDSAPPTVTYELTQAAEDL